MAGNGVNLDKLDDALKHAQFQQVSGRVVHAVGPLLESRGSPVRFWVPFVKWATENLVRLLGSKANER